MELTQRLECTQDLYPKTSEKEFPDQIGFLGICGTKYPLKKGPNKIGRDPDTCNIVLNLNSISRQHAVINILNNYEFMLMDLDSANKTKISDKTLQAYIPHPLKNGDMVQFGQVFGVFRLFEEDNDLPMTQAIDVPETPVHSKHVSKLNNIHVTTIPESPDVSDREESFIAASQQKPENVFKSPNNFIKTSGKTISIKPIGTNRIDNVYWSSSKKSDSFNLSNNDVLVETDNISNQQNIHELDTQVTDNCNDSVDSIYNANTQFIVNPISPTIHSMETQIPTDLPEVCKIQDQYDVHFNFTTDNKENDNNLSNAESKLEAKQSSIKNVNDEISTPLECENKDNDNISDDVILFDDIEGEPLQDNFESQALLPPEFDCSNDDKHDTSKENTKEKEEEIKINQNVIKRSHRLKSDSSTDCDDDINIAMTQKIPEVNNDDITDCEDEIEAFTKTIEQKNEKNVSIDEDVTDCEDNLDENDFIQPNKEININDLDTQVIEKDISIERNNIMIDHSKKQINLEDFQTQIIEEDKNSSKEVEPVVSFEDLPTQIITEEPEKDIGFAEALTQQIYSQEIITPFKVPSISSLKGKRKDVSDLKIVKQLVNSETRKSSNNDSDNELYYAATQDIFNDLCSQREISPKTNKTPLKQSTASIINGNVDNVSTVDRIISNPSGQDSGDESDIENRIENFVSNLSNSQIRDVVSVKKVSSDSSDLEVNPKKINSISFLNTKLPNTDEIKKYLSVSRNENSEESENDDNMRSPVRIRNRKKLTQTKLDFTKDFDSKIVPTRIITRIRKPTPKMLNYNDTTKNLCGNILKSEFFTDRMGEKYNEVKTEKVVNINDKANKTKTKSEHNDKKNNAKDQSKTKKIDKIKVEKKKSDNKKPKGKRTKEKDDSLKLKQLKLTTMQSDNEKVLKNDNAGRSTRSRSKQKAEDNSDKKIELETKEKPHRARSTEKKKYNSRNKITEKRESPEKEVRRSRRQRSSKKTEETLKNYPKQKNDSKVSHEQSTVYNMSSDSTTDSPNKLKRSATENFEIPSAKKTKTATNVNNLSLRANPARKVKTHYVLFTAFLCEEVKVKLQKLGAIIVSDVTECTVVLTMQIKRTFKLLCAVGLGKPIVGPAWVQACSDTSMIVDPWQYLIKDEETEKRFQFNLERSLAVRRGFLKGYNISSTPSVMPNALEMKLIVECSGGTWKDQGPNWICVSAIPDKGLWPALKKKGAIIVSTEFILAGVLRQKVEIDKNRLT